MTILIITKEKSGLDKYSRELGKRLEIPKIESKRYFSLKEGLHFFRVIRHQDDVMHFPSQHFARYALFLRKPFLITVHDLARICFSLNREAIAERWWLKLDVKGIRKANHIIAVSQNTKDDLINYLKIPPERITVIYNGLDHSLFQPRKGRLFDKPYILYVGSERPRKNLNRLLEAFSKLKREFKLLKLVKVGSPGRSEIFRKNTLAQIEKLGLREEVIFVDHVPENELPYYYSFASLLVYPSLYEGFGFPLLEAMACGCPVITSNTSSLPEVVGEAGIMVNPYDVDALAGAMGRVLTDQRLRSGMIERGLAQAKGFSWEKTARETGEVYERVALELSRKGNRLDRFQPSTGKGLAD